MKRLAVIALLSLSHLIIYAQKTIRGRVLSDEGQPLFGATVKIDNSLYGTTTNENGDFEIRRTADSLTLEISYIGFKKQVIEIGEQMDKDLTIQMDKDVYLADELIVSATRASAHSPLTYENLNKEEIEKMNTGKDLPYILNQSTSLVSMSDAGAGVGYTGLRIRGIDQANINVTINGIALNDAESHGVYWVDVPDFASSLSDIQIQRGVGTSTNGAGAFGATINLQTDGMTKDPYGQISTSAGSFNTAKGTFKFGSGMINDRWYFDGRLSRISSDGYVDRASTEMNSYFLSTGFNNGKTSVKALVFGGVETTYQAWYGVDSATLATDRKFNYAGAKYDDDGNVTGYYDNEVDYYEQDHYQLHLNQKIGKYFRLNLAGHLTHGRGYYEQFLQSQNLLDYGVTPLNPADTSIQATDLVVRQWLQNYYYGMTYNLNFTKGKFVVDLGGGLNQYDGDHFGEFIWARNSGNSDLRDRYYFNRGVKDDFNTYLKFLLGVGEKTTLFLDLQERIVNYTVDGTHDYLPDLLITDQHVFFNPKIGVDVRLNPKNEIYYTLGVANREPNRSDYLADANFEAKPERLYDNELGYKTAIKGNPVQANAYFMYYRDQLVLTGAISDVGEPIRDNVGESYRAGLELSAEFHIFKKLRWKPNGGYSLNRNLNFRTVDENGDFKNESTPIAFSPQIVEKSTLEYQPFKFLVLTLYSRYVGEQFMDNTGSDKSKLPDYAVHDFRIDYKPKIKRIKDVNIYFAVYNILNEQYVANGYMYNGTPYYFPQAGTNFMGGLQLKF